MLRFAAGINNSLARAILVVPSRTSSRRDPAPATSTVPQGDPTAAMADERSRPPQTREQRAMDVLSDYQLDILRREPHGVNVYQISTPRGDRSYTTTGNWCSCPDYTYRGRQVGACKHMHAVRTLDGWK